MLLSQLEEIFDLAEGGQSEKRKRTSVSAVKKEPSLVWEKKLRNMKKLEFEKRGL